MMDERQLWAQRSIERLQEVLTMQDVQRALGVRAVRRIERVLDRVYIPDIIGTEGDTVRISSSALHRNDGSLPLMASYAGEEVVLEGVSLTPTGEQRERSIAKITGAGTPKAEAATKYNALIRQFGLVGDEPHAFYPHAALRRPLIDKQLFSDDNDKDC